MDGIQMEFSDGTALGISTLGGFYKRWCLWKYEPIGKSGVPTYTPLAYFTKPEHAAEAMRLLEAAPSVAGQRGGGAG